MTGRARVDSLARRAGRRPISAHARAYLEDALAELDALLTEPMTAEQQAELVTGLEALLKDVERIVGLRPRS